MTRDYSKIKCQKPESKREKWRSLMFTGLSFGDEKTETQIREDLS